MIALLQLENVMSNPPPDSDRFLPDDPAIPDDLVGKIIYHTYTMPRDVWKSALAEVYDAVKEMTEPLSHGTSRYLFDSILQQGLGSRAHQPEFSRHRGSTALCTLQTREGWLGSYGFATWDDTQYLAVDARSVLGHGIVRRFCEVASRLQDAWFGKRALWRFGMQRTVNNYLNEREARDHEDALFLILEGGNDLSYTCTNRAIPVEARTADIIGKEKLRYAFVPARKCKDTIEQLARNNASHIKVLPIELFELEAIYEDTRIKR